MSEVGHGTQGLMIHAACSAAFANGILATQAKEAVLKGKYALITDIYQW